MFALPGRRSSNGSAVFVPSFGDLFLISEYDARDIYELNARFRPLFWGFVFNLNQEEKMKKYDIVRFSSPLLGICF